MDAVARAVSWMADLSPSLAESQPAEHQGASAWKNGRSACSPASTRAWACKLEVAHELGVPTIQLHAPGAANRARPRRARRFLATLNDMGIRLTAVFGGFEGESYADIPTVARTVGLVPPATRAARTREMKEIADFARLLEVDVVALHLGFVPHDDSDPLYREVLAVTRDLCDHCRSNGQALHLETGQEPADALLEFLHDVERDNLFVNFDPANMILYGSGEPIAALEKIGRYVRSVHCKDGTLGRQPRPRVGQRSAARRRGRRLRKLSAHARRDRLSRPAHDRARNPAGARAAESRDRPRHPPASRAEGEARVKRGTSPPAGG